MTQSVVISDAFSAPGAGPAGLAWNGETLWHADFCDGRIYALDPQDGSIRRTIYCPGNLSGLAWDGRSLWQSLFDQEMVRRINPATNDFDEAIILSGHGWLSGVAWDKRRLWVVAQQTGHLLSIDLNSSGIHSSLDSPVAMGDIDYCEGHLWASVATPMRFDSELGRFVWLTDSPEYAIVKIDPQEGGVLAKYPVDKLFSGLCWVGDVLYLAQTESRKILIAHLN